MGETLIEKFETGSESDIEQALLDFNKQHAQSFSFPEYDVDTKKKLLALIFKQLNDNENQGVACLEAVRILSRDKKELETIFSKSVVSNLVNLAGLIAEEEEIINQSEGNPDDKRTCRIVEAQKILCNLIYNNKNIQRECCSNGCVEGIMLRLRTYKDPGIAPEVKFFDMRMLFLLTALCADLRPKLRTELHGLTYLMEVLDLILKSNVEQLAKHSQHTRSKRRYKKGKNAEREISYFPCLDNNEVDLSSEVLKVLFNLTVNVEKYNIEEEEEAHYMRLVCILHDILLCETKTPEKKDELQSHTIDLLLNMPLSSYEELLTPIIDGPKENEIEFEGMNMDAIKSMLDFLEKRLNQPNKTYKELLAPVLTTLGESARANSCIRKFLRSKVLPPLKDVMNRPEEGHTVRNKLVKLMTSPVFDVKELVADFLFVLCKENVLRLIKYTGYGNAAGLLANRGLMLGGHGTGNYSSDSGDSDTEEYLKFKDRINPVVGCYQEPKTNLMEDMSEEQKEYEAMQLVQLMDKMARDGLVQPMMVGDDGRPHAVSHILELQDGAAYNAQSKNHKDPSDSD